MTTMREHVDAIQGAGSWDRMHDMIDAGETEGWTLPPVEVDGIKCDVFPGTNREVTLEAVQDELRKMFAQRGPRMPGR